MTAEAARDRTEILFLGTEAVVPGCGGDTASFVINGRYLVDTGWYAAIKMQCYGISPLDIEILFLTHCHHDHYLGLPALLFYLTMRARERPSRAPLKIVGPAADLERVVRLSQQLLQPDVFPPVRYEPELIPMTPGDTYDDAGLTVATGASVHPVPALCYRFTDKRTGAVFAYTGDTAYDSGVIEHVRGASLLIHEASFGASPTPANNTSLHSSAPDAARAAAEAGVSRLALVHCPRANQAAALKAARAIFPNTFWPADGEVVTVE